MKRFQYFLEYAVIRGFEVFLRLPPRGWAVRLGEWIGIAMSFILSSRQKLILDNLTHAFPEKSDAEKKKIANQMWRNIGRTAVEFIRVDEAVGDDLEKYVILDGFDHLEKALRGGKGVILLGSHFSNWEMTGVLCQHYTQNLTSIARPMKNPFVEKWVQSKRMKGGMKIILHREAVKASLKCLKAKNTLGILVDQNLYTGGEFVDFFGRPAATTTLPALLHIRTGAPVLNTYNLREGMKFRLCFEPVNFPSHVDEKDRVRAYTQVLTRAVEDIVRKNPGNWFWIHNRWKRKPA